MHSSIQRFCGVYPVRTFEVTAQNQKRETTQNPDGGIDNAAANAASLFRDSLANQVLFHQGSMYLLMDDEEGDHADQFERVHQNEAQVLEDLIQEHGVENLTMDQIIEGMESLPETAEQQALYQVLANIGEASDKEYHVEYFKTAETDADSSQPTIGLHRVHTGFYAKNTDIVLPSPIETMR